MERLLCVLSGMNRGGAETFLMKIDRSLDHSKYQMDFCINVTEKCAYEDEIISLGGKIFRIPMKTESAVKFKKGLYSVVKDNHYKNVLRITSNAAGFWDLKIAKEAGAKHTVARSSNASDGGRLKSIIAHRIGQLLWMKYVDTMIAPSDLAAKYTFGEKNYKDGRVYKLNNGLDLNAYRFDIEKRKMIRMKYNIPQDAIVLGHVGRFAKQKNHTFLIQVFASYIKKHPNAYLMLIGDGDLRAEIERQVANVGLTDKTIFVGQTDEIAAYLSAMDVFVFPSLYEGMPNTVIEAQASGLPCVISDTITKEANVTGNVSYLAIDHAERWGDYIADISLERRKNVDMSAYDIKEVVKRFIELCYLN